MDRGYSFSIVLLLIAFVVATVTCFPAADDKFGAASTGFGNGDFFNSRKFQNWLDKRGLEGSSFGFGSRLGDNGRLMDWRDILAASNGLMKRQLGYGPRSFGNFQRYFAGDLQDWRNTFGNMHKREAPNENMEPAASQQEQLAKSA